MLDRPGRGEHLAFAQLLGHCPARQLHHRQQFGAFGGPQTLDLAQVLFAGLGQPGNAVESGAAAGHAGQLQQFMRHLQHTLASNAGAQQQGQQFGVGQSGSAAGQQLLARARVRGQGVQVHWRVMVDGVGAASYNKGRPPRFS